MQQFIKTIILFLLFSTPSWAATWYIRDGGGNRTQCTGKTNAVYPGSGTAQNCAFSNPMYVGGAGCGNTGGNTCDVAAQWNTGDIINIDGDSDLNPGSQAQYPIGLDVNGIVTPTNGTNCFLSAPINCTMSNLPDGATIQTTPGSSHRAQLYGREHVAQVLNDNYTASTGNSIINLEITQHSACVYNGVDPNNTTDGFPNVCHTSGNGFSSPFGNWGLTGISLTGTNITLQNNWIHGMAQWGVTTGSLSNLTETGNIINGNGGGGFGLGQNNSGGSITISGTNNISNEVIVFNGCGEHYPIHSSNPYDTLNYHHCADDGSSNGTILADGWACEASTCSLSSSDSINMTNVHVDYNTKGGVDNLHMNASGTFNLYRVRSEGNESQQLKMNEATVNVENSQLINNCNFFQGQSFTTAIDGCGNTLPHFYAVNTCDGNTSAYTATWDFCRAAGNTIRVALASNSVANISNSTLTSDGGSNVELAPIASCNSSTKVNLYNNVIINQADFTNGSTQNTTFWENDTGIGGCNPVVEDYNIDYQDHTPALCAGAHDICNNPANAGVTGGFNLSSNPAGGQSFLTTGQADQLYPSSSGPLISAANSSLALTGTSNDYNQVTRSPSTYTIGSYTNNSSVANGNICFTNTECASGNCTNNICGTGTCTGNGGICSGGPIQASCCSGLCSGSLCVACIATGNACSVTANCCTGSCTGGFCSSTPIPSAATLVSISGATTNGKCNF